MTNTVARIDKTPGASSETRTGVPGASEWPLFFVGAALAAALLAILAWPMLNGLVYTYDDLGNYHLPARAFYAKCLAGGLDFNWWPGVYCGYYLQGDGQAGMYHPFHRLIYGMLGLNAAFDLELFLSYPVMLAGMFFLLRRWRLRRDAALFGALLFTFSGFNLLHFMHLNMVAIVAQMPWVLAVIDVSIRTNNRRTAAVANLAIALLVASQILLSHPQYVLFSSMVEILYVFLLKPYWRSAWRLAAVAAAKALGIMMGAVQLLPNYDALRLSDRWHSAAYSSSQLSLPPWNLVQLVAPYLLKARVFLSNEDCANTQEFALYDGAIALVLFVWLAMGLWGRQAAWKRGNAKRRLALGAAAFTLVSLALAFGRYGGLYSLLAAAPLVGSFRAPARYIVLVHFGMAVSGALAFDALASAGREQLSRLRTGLLLALPALSAAALLLVDWPGGGHHAWAILAPRGETSARLLMVGPLVTTLAAMIVIAASRGSRVALIGIMIAAAADQGAYGLSFVRATPAETVAAVAESVRLPAVPPPYRIEGIPTYDSIATLGGYRQVTGYVGLRPRRALDYTRTAPLRLASTMFEIVKTEAPDAAGGTVGRLSLVDVMGTMPKARLVGAESVAAEAQAAIQNVDIASTAVVDRSLGLEGGAPGAAELTRDLPGDMAIIAYAPSRQLLVISESYHDGWRAAVDGKAAKIVRVYGDFMGVAVSKGRRDVVLRFAPESLRVGKIISEAGLWLALLVFAVSIAMPGRRGLSPDGTMR